MKLQVEGVFRKSLYRWTYPPSAIAGANLWSRFLLSQEALLVKKILVPTIESPISSETAYQVAERADAIGADVVLLYIAESLEPKSFQLGNLAVEIFEEAAQNYDFKVDGYVLSGEPQEVILAMADRMNVDLILLDCDQPSRFELKNTLHSASTSCLVETIDPYI